MKTRTNMSQWELFERAIASGALTRLFIEGPPGVGKSSVARALLSKKCADVMTVYFNEDLTSTELSGHWVPKGNRFEKWEGKLIKAASNGLGLLLDEVGRAAAAVQDLLLMVLDDSKDRKIETPLGRWKVHPDLIVIATSNSPLTDLDPALADRFEGSFKVTTPHPNIIRELNSKVANLGDVVFDSYSDSNIITPRRAFALARLAEAGFSLEDSAKVVLPGLASDFVDALKIRRAANSNVPKEDDDETEEEE